MGMYAAMRFLTSHQLRDAAHISQNVSADEADQRFLPQNAQPTSHRDFLVIPPKESLKYIVTIMEAEEN